MDAAVDWTYSDWTEALADEFFSPSFAGEPVTFAVDEFALARLTGLSPGDAVDALASVVGQSTFAHVKAECLRWRTGSCSDPPPSLPLLGLTVLAVTRSANYGQHPELRKLLQLPGEGEVPGYADVVPLLWTQLRWWLDEHLGGARGTSTIETHPHFHHVGYSINQAIVRAQDRPLFYRFLRSIRFDPNEDEVVAVELRRALRVWAMRQGFGAERLMRLASDTSIEELADLVITRLAQEWDGRLRDPQTGSKMVPMRLMLGRLTDAIGVVAPVPDGGPKTLEVAGDDGLQVLLTSQGAHYEPAPLPMEVDDNILRDGCELHGDNLSFFLDGAQAFVFRRNDDLAAWVSTDRFRFGERHLLLIPSGLKAQTQAWLSAEGIEGSLNPAATKNYPNGESWLVFVKVRLNARPATEAPEAVAGFIGSASTGERLRLTGGLRLAAPPRTFLSGGAPNISVPEELRGQEFEIRKGGLHDPIRVTCDKHEFELGAYPLEPGDYEVINPVSTIRFSIVGEIAEQPGSGVGEIVTESGSSSVSGLDIENSAEETPHTVPIFGREPMVVLWDEPSATVASVPQWIEHLDDTLSWNHIDVWGAPGSTPAWLLTLRSGRWIARCLNSVPPASSRSDCDWARLLAGAELEPSETDETTIELWRQYKAAAGADIT